MATDYPGSTSGLFGGVMGSGKGVRPRAEYPTESGGHTAVPGADGNFLGNVHLGRGVDPEAHADTVTADGGVAPAGGPAPVEIPADGLPIALPLVPSFPGVSIAIEVAGLPENTVLSSGHAMSSGRWQLDLSEAPGLRLLSAAGAGDNALPGPLSLGVSYVVTDNVTGEARVVQLGPVSAVADIDSAANTVSESAADGDSVGINAAANDPDSYDRVIYTLLDDAGGRFAIDPLTGEVTVKDASLLDYETATSHTIVVQAESTDGSKTSATFTIELTDDNTEFSVTPVADTDAAADGISETASNGDVVGVTAFASDTDATDTVTYSLTDDAGGRFAIDAATGVVTVADASLLDYETATGHTITVQATSTDGSTETKTFTISLSDDTSEFAVTPVADTDAAADGVSESASDGDTVGITAFASDGDATDTITYSLTDDAGGRFTIDATTGVVTVADASLLDYETATSHTITVQATSTDGSTETQDFTIALADDTGEFTISKITDADATKNRVSESTTDGTVVGVTAFASDADGSDTVTYSLTNDAGGRFAIDATTGVVTVADASLLDYESAKSHKITVLATSSDGSTATKSFTVNIADDRTEFSVSPVTDADASTNTVSESASNGDVVGVTAFADDADRSDKVTYKLLDDAGGRFAIDSKTGVVTVADASLLDYENAASHEITVRARSSDHSTQTQTFTIALADDTGEYSVTPVVDANAAADSVSESATNGDVVGVTAFASDGDATDTITYSLTDDAGGRFAIDAATGVVTVADGSLLDYETATSQTITVQATSSDGSTETKRFTIALSDDTGEFSVTPVADADASADGVSESASNGDVVGVTAFASDGDATDTVTYSLTDDAGGRFAIDASTGVVTVADASLLDYETATSHTITVQAASTDGSTETKSFTIVLADDTSEFTVSAVSDTNAAADGISEGASNGDVVGVTAFASDADATDTVTYSLTDNAGGRFAIDATTGVVTVADASLLDYETTTSHTITVQAMSSDGSTVAKTFTIALADDTSEFTVTPVTDANAAADSVSESASNGDVVGVTAFASDGDATDSVTYSLTDDAGGRFAVDATTGVVTVADASLLDYETATSHTITVQAESSDGSTETKSFTVALSDDTGEFSVSALSDTDAASDGVSESASNGDTVGVTAFASDADASDTVTYSLADNAGGRFTIDATTGVVTVADASLLDYETATSHTITVQAESSDGSTETKSFIIALSDDTSEFSVAPVADTDAAADTVSEGASNGDTVGITAFASDADATDTVTYSLTDDAGGRFAIDATTGQVTVADASQLDYETAASHTITVQAESSDGSTTTQNFTIDVTDVNEAPTGGSVQGPSPAPGAALHLDATDIDADGGTADNPGNGSAVSRWDDASGGNHDAVQQSSAPVVAAGAINGKDAIDFSGANDALHVSDTSAINLDTYEERSHAIAFQTGDDISGFQVIYEEGANIRGYSLSIAPDPANGGQPTLWAFVYNNAEWGSGDQYKAINLGPVAANETYNVIMVHDASAADLSDRTFSAYVNGDYMGTVTEVDVQYPHSGDIGIGGYLDTTINPVTNEVLSGNGGEFAGKVGEVLIWNSALDTQQISETSSYLNEKWGGAPSVGEDAPNGTAVFAVADIVDPDGSDTYTYSLADDAGGRFAIDASTGVVTVSDASLIDYDAAQSHAVTVRVTDAGGNTLEIPVTIEVGDGNDVLGALSDADAATDTVSEGASNGDVVGITAFASDADIGDTVTYSLTDDAGGRFAIDASTGIVTVADASLLDYETATSHTITVEAASADGSTQTQDFTIALSDDTSEFSVSAVTDANAAANTISEHASNGDTVGITGFASDADASDTITYSLTDDAGGRFTIDATTGVVTVADASLLDHDTADSHTVTVLAASSDGSTQTQDFAIAVTTDYNELHGPGFVVGTEGDDRITGTSNSESHGGEEIMLGLGGDDVLIGNGNEDRLIGGAGDDTLSGGDQSDVLAGGAGDDTVDGGSGNDVFVFRMGDGHDTVSGGSGDDTIMLVGADGGSPDPSDWSLNLTSGSASWSMDNVSLSADAAGTITFTDGSSMTFDGVETIDFSGSYDIDGDGSHGGGPHGGGSHGTGQVLIADAGGDSVSGGSGEDTIFGGSGADTLSGGDNEDLLMGGEGGDALYGGNDNDVLYGDGGSDALYGDKGDDVLVGGDGGDALYGGQGNDVLYGDAGNDALYGEDGNDTLYGGTGDDAAYGGKGDDTYIFGAGMGTDSFAGGGGPWTDTIQLSGVDGVTAYNGWTLADATVVDSGDGYIELAADSDGTITMDDGSELTFTDVDRIEW